MIRNDPPKQRDDRAVSVAVTHVLAIGITTILIVGLLTAAGGMAEDEQERSAQKQLQMIGSSMANQIERADDLGRRGANVTVREEFEGTVSGQSYTVDFETDCDAATIETDACLVLDLTTSDISTTVGVNNRSAVTFEHLGSGTVRIVSEPGGAPGDTPYDPSIIEQVGVGGNVYDLPPGTGSLAELNKPPVAKFTIDPGMPQFQEVVLLNASESKNDKRNIISYIWKFDWDQDGTTDYIMERSKPKAAFIANRSFVGATDVTLIVEDDVGKTGETDQLLKVAAIKLHVDKDDKPDDPKSPRAVNTTGNGTPSALVLQATNYHTDGSIVRQILVNPENTTIDQLAEYTDINKSKDFQSNQTEFWGESDSTTNTTHIDYSSNNKNSNCEDKDKEGVNMTLQGKIFALVDGGKPDIYNTTQYCQDPNGGHLLIEKDEETATLRFQEFRTASGSEVDISQENIDIKIRYTVNGNFYASQFIANPNKPYPDWESPNSAKRQQYSAHAGDGNKNIKVSHSDSDVPDDGYEWEILTNESGINAWLEDKKPGEKYIKWTPTDLSEKKEVVVEVTITDTNGNKNTVRLLVEITP